MENYVFTQKEKAAISGSLFFFVLKGSDCNYIMWGEGVAVVYEKGDCKQLAYALAVYS